MSAVRVGPADPLDRAAARQREIEAYLPLVQSVARRFAGRGERLEDLVQVGSIAMINAVDHCDPRRRGLLGAYIARSVDGAIRRHLRDRCSPVRIPRRVQQLAAGQWAESGPPLPALREPLALDEQAEESSAAGDDPLDLGVARALVAAAARTLDARERRIVLLRYFLDQSQEEIARAEGLSQVHVSRLLERAITKMGAALGEGDPAGLSGEQERR